MFSSCNDLSSQTWTITKTCPLIQRFLELKKKIEKFKLKNFDKFLVFDQNMDCGYTLKGLVEAVLTSTHNVLSKNMKNTFFFPTENFQF